MKVDDKNLLSAAASRLVKDVEDRIETSPGDRAALRRSLGRSPQDVLSHPAIAIVARHVPEPLVPTDKVRGTRGISLVEAESVERAFYAVAALIAAQPRQSPQDEAEQDDTEHDGSNEQEGESDVSGAADDAEERPEAPAQPSLGTTLALAVAAPRSPLRHDTIEARLHLLCRQRLDGLHRQLPRLIAQLRVTRVPVDWPRLVVDLARWGTESDLVAKRWLQDYYRTYFRLTATADKSEPTDPSEDQ
ncbi:hypothetical protein amrb99_45740 [Actinomadura sp. RB99]|uniref:type I-E CRISPR-associated protein Cse2/CasB n=1 Tax=Actinomadura sp. RB99 TaxID=2691577 RepID=UPI0016843E29|nr:type I-E CRISPR-associated protein Cse2/CasB [Actinomadura sp. RB99]MBD2895635.1 hypothetical protein [Actinomadura sp. RB99]